VGTGALPLGCCRHRQRERADVHVLVMAAAGDDCHGTSVRAVSGFSVPEAGKRLGMGLSAERAAENESIFRDANERV
jgi:hypothetical protein